MNVTKPISLKKSKKGKTQSGGSLREQFWQCPDCTVNIKKSERDHFSYMCHDLERIF